MFRSLSRAAWPFAMMLVVSSLGCASSRVQVARDDWAAAAPPDTVTVAKEEPAEVRTLEELLAVGEERNLELRSVHDRWLAALEATPQARSLPDPRFSYAYYLESVETRVGPQRQKFGLSQTIPIFGQLGLREEIALAEANALGAQYEKARRKLRYDLIRLWNESYYLGRAIDVTQENVRLMTSIENVALNRYSAGRESHSSVIRAQMELGRLEDRLRTLMDQLRPLRAQMNARLNRPETASIAMPDSIPPTATGPEPEELRAMLLERNPELLALRHREEKEAQSAKLAGRSAWPDLTLGAEYIDTGEARMPGVSDSGKDAAMATASITLPLWYGKHRAAGRAADARLVAATRERQQLEKMLIAEFEQVMFGVRDAERRVDLYAYTLLPKARQALDVLEDAFAAGEAGFLDLVDAERTLLEFQLAHERALADQATSTARLEQIVGHDLLAPSQQQEGSQP